jgi:predicted MFS family arabinose efflux permease
VGAARPGAGSVIAVGGFLFLWNFNPFSNAVLHVHMTRALGLSERFYGMTVALTAVASIAASVAYGLYCRRVPMPVLVHASIVLGVVSTLGYAAVSDERSAVLVTLAVGVSYMTATLIQLDLAARACPPEVAGTLFALLMALENLGASSSTWLGGLLYDRGIDRWESRGAFLVLVLVGSAFTAGCWLLVPFLPRAAISPAGIDGDSSRTGP